MLPVTMFSLASDGPSICPISILTVTHLGAARDAASVDFSQTIRRTDRLVILHLQCQIYVQNAHTVIYISQRYDNCTCCHRHLHVSRETLSAQLLT